MLGTCVTFVDPTVTESLTRVLDFVWIDTEHNPLSLEHVQGHLMATKGTETTPLVRVPANDPVLIKPVLDIGRGRRDRAAGQNGRRRAAGRGRLPLSARGHSRLWSAAAVEYGARAARSICQDGQPPIITIVQIEQREALENLDAILAVPGLTSIVVGPNDLAASLGYTGQPRHPEVIAAIDTVIAKARAARIPMGIAVGDDPEVLVEWIERESTGWRSPPTMRCCCARPRNWSNARSRARADVAAKVKSAARFAHRQVRDDQGIAMPDVLITTEVLRDAPGKHVDLLRAAGFEVRFPAKNGAADRGRHARSRCRATWRSSPAASRTPIACWRGLPKLAHHFAQRRGLRSRSTCRPPRGAASP